jgi:Holliday junction resolvase
MTPEGKVKAKVKAILKEYGAYTITPFTAGYGASGAPDLIVCYKGKFIGIECKAGKNRPTALQTHHLSDITDCGGYSLVIRPDNIETVRELLESL